MHSPRIDAVKSDGICITRRDAFRSRSVPMGIDRRDITRSGVGWKGRGGGVHPAGYTALFYSRARRILLRSTFARPLRRMSTVASKFLPGCIRNSPPAELALVSPLRSVSIGVRVTQTVCRAISSCIKVVSV